MYTYANKLAPSNFILGEHNLNIKKTMCHSMHYEDYNLLTYEYIVFNSRFLVNLGLALSSCERALKETVIYWSDADSACWGIRFRVVTS